MIIAAYAGCGKSTFAKMNPKSAVDFHCMPYKYYLEEDNDIEGEKCKANPDNEIRPEWPYNYVDAIEELMNVYKYILIPSDSRVLTLLEDEQIPYTLIYPHRDSKEEYRQRYVNRGNTEHFLSIFYERWDRFIDRLESDCYGKHIVLQSNQFIADVIDTSD